MVGKTALNKEMKHLNGAYFRTIIDLKSKMIIKIKDINNNITLSY